MDEKGQIFSNEEIVNTINGIVGFCRSQDIPAGLMINACLNLCLNGLKMAGVDETRIRALTQSFLNAFMSSGGEGRLLK